MGDLPHIMKSLVYILGVRITDMDQAGEFIVSLGGHISGGSAVGLAPQMRLDDQSNITHGIGALAPRDRTVLTSCKTSNTGSRMDPTVLTALSTSTTPTLTFVIS